MLEHFGKTRKNRYRMVVCNVFRVSIFEKWYYFSNFHFFRKTPFSSDTLNKCFRGSLISPKHFLIRLKSNIVCPVLTAYNYF